MSARAIIEERERWSTSIQKKPRGSSQDEWRTAKTLRGVSRKKLHATMRSFREGPDRETKTVYRFRPIGKEKLQSLPGKAKPEDLFKND